MLFTRVHILELIEFVKLSASSSTREVSMLQLKVSRRRELTLKM
jgi:hypothetical protein